MYRITLGNEVQESMEKFAIIDMARVKLLPPQTTKSLRKTIKCFKFL